MSFLNVEERGRNRAAFRFAGKKKLIALNKREIVREKQSGGGEREREWKTEYKKCVCVPSRGRERENTGEYQSEKYGF